MSFIKKAVYTLLAILIFGCPLWFCMEIAYRYYFRIPFWGGVPAQNGARLPDNAWHRQVATRFRRSPNRVLFYEPVPNARSEIYQINSHGFRDR